ncbi:MAG TPA: hypothetical protein DCM40_00890, partial [Maribacter sp.]|nr:hypothetical protein [Maribacter sp.]
PALLVIAEPLPNILKKKPSVLRLLFNLIILFIICMSPAYLINVYRSANVLVKKDKYILKKYKIDSISSITTSDTQNRVAKTSSYLVFFNNKKEKLKISIINENSFSFSKRTKSIYKDFENNILKENGWMGRSRSDSIYIWKSTNSNIYGFKD